MGYKLICDERVYPKQYFTTLQKVRLWLFQHARIQLDMQSDLRESKDIGHDIDLRSSDTYELADYFDFTLTIR